MPGDLRGSGDLYDMAKALAIEMVWIEITLKTVRTYCPSSGLRVRLATVHAAFDNFFCLVASCFLLWRRRSRKQHVRRKSRRYSHGVAVMFNEPVTIIAGDFQTAWLEAVGKLESSNWELSNLVVYIRDPAIVADGIHNRVTAFAEQEDLLTPKAVAYTIFPEQLYRKGGSADDLFRRYNRKEGFFDRVRTTWGTYFRRFTKYKTPSGDVNQLGKIIDALRDRQNVSKAAYIMVVPCPGGENVRPLGGPCLNYVAVQAKRDPADDTVNVGLLAVYRNHDFLERAYGNYWGLCNLLRFIANEVGATPAPLTCISSHAYVANKKTALKQFVAGL